MEKNNKKILVVEDEYLNFIYLEKILSLNHYTVVHANNGKQAIDMCNASIDIVLMDIKMPIMDGYEATRKIKEVYPALPIVALTAYAMEEDRQRALDVGCDEYLSKPIDRKIILEIIFQLTKSKLN